MIYLFFSILASVSNAVILKRGEAARHDRLVVMGMNYVVASLLAGLIWAAEGAIMPAPVTIWLGLVGGFFFAVGLFLWMGAINVAGLATSTTIMRMSVVLPVAVSILYFSEIPSVFQASGIGIAIVTILLIAVASRSLRLDSNGTAIHGGNAATWLITLFFCAGGAHTTLKFYTEIAPPQDRPAVLALIFIFAGIMTWTAMLRRRRVIVRSDLVSGGLFGIFNVASNGLLLTALKTVPGVLAFPLTNTGIIFLSSFIGVTVWRERPGRLGYLAICTSAFAIVLLSL